MDRKLKAFIIVFPAIVDFAVLGVSGHFYLLAVILALSLVTMVGFARNKPFAPVGSALAYLVSVFGSASLPGSFGQGLIAPLVALFFSPIGIIDGVLLYLDDRRRLLGSLGKGLFAMGVVFDLISIGSAQGNAGLALGINAPFFLTSAIVSASHRNLRANVKVNRAITKSPVYQPNPSPRSPPPPPQPQAPQTPPVTFVLQGIPQGFNAEIRLTYYIGGKRVTDVVWGNGVVTTTRWGEWVAKGVKIGNVVYLPQPSRGKVYPGQVVYITYTPQPFPQSPQSHPRQNPRRKTGQRQPAPQAQQKPTDPLGIVGRVIAGYEVVNYLGEGGTGYVYLVRSNGVDYAMKVIKVNAQGTPEQYFKDLIRESANISDLSEHGNVVKVYAVSIDLGVISEALRGDLRRFRDNPPRIIMEYMAGGSLDKYMKDDMFFYSSSWERAMTKAVKETAEALVYLHGKGYVHLDVKPQNVFLDRKPKDPSDLLNVNFKLGDLGSAVRAGKPVTQLTTEYAPPEAFYDVARPSMDVFALGMTLYKLLTRKMRPDFYSMEEAFDCYIRGDKNCVRAKVEEAKVLLTSWDPEVREPFKSLIKAMTDPNPMKRITADEAVSRLRGLL